MGIFGLGDESWWYLELGTGVGTQKKQALKRKEKVHFSKFNLILWGILVDIAIRN